MLLVIKKNLHLEKKESSCPTIFNGRFPFVVLRAFLLLACFINAFPSLSQNQPKKVRLIKTDELLYDIAIVDAQRLKGNVQLEYEGTMFYCDSAYLYANDNFDAFGSIRIIKGAEYTLTGETLHFDKASHSANVDNKVILRDRDMTLSTDHLVYNTESEVASYFGGGKIISTRDRNVLTSNKGFYHSKTQTFYFRKDVVLKNPDYTVESDTLQYNQHSEIAYFYGPTNIKGGKTDLYCENGYYNTKKDQCRFGKNAQVNSENHTLKGDSIFYDGKKRLGEVFRNVSIEDTTSNFIITGQYGLHNEITKESFVTREALLTQIFENSDTIFVHADTLRSMPDSLDRNIVKAFYGVRIFKTDMQGKCDSLVYSEADSTMKLFKNPVMWSDKSQITGDSIEITTSNGVIKNLVVKGNAFIISEADTGKFNQIKGRRLTGYFTKNVLSRVYIEGNGQLVYFPEDDKKKRAKVMGHNKGDCSNINIEIAENQIQRIRMETAPNSVFSPLSLAPVNDFKLEDFLWRIGERPRSREDLFEEH
jgi:lipopolysaccharide export system protein LptA